MNLLVVISTPTYGGPHNQVLRLNEQLRSHGVHQIVIVPADSKESYQRLVENGIEVYKYPIRRIRRLTLVGNNLSFLFNYRSGNKAFRNIIKKHDIDLVQVCGLLNFQAAIAARSCDKPVVWQLLSSDFVPKPLRNFLCFLVTKYADSTMHVGAATLLKHPFNSSFKNKVNFHPPVNTKNFRPNPEKSSAVRQKLNIPSDALVIGTIGNRVKPKSHERIVNLIDDVVKQNHNCYFVICGKKDKSHERYYNKEVISGINKLENKSNLRLVEWQGDVNEMLNAFDIFLSLSHTEGMPTVILEAMSSGLPIVSTNVGSVTEVMDNEVNGFIISNYNQEEGLEALLKLINDAPARAEMAKKNMERAKKNFSIEHCIQLHLAAYQLAKSSRKG